MGLRGAQLRHLGIRASSSSMKIGGFFRTYGPKNNMNHPYGCYVIFPCVQVVFANWLCQKGITVKIEFLRYQLFFGADVIWRFVR